MFAVLINILNTLTLELNEKSFNIEKIKFEIRKNKMLVAVAYYGKKIENLMPKTLHSIDKESNKISIRYRGEKLYFFFIFRIEVRDS